MRDCKNCKNYVVSDVKRNYETSGCGMYQQEIYSCCKWDCEFESKDEQSPGILIGYYDGEPVYRFDGE